MFNILVLVYAIFYLVLAQIRPTWAMMLIIAALPSYLIRFSLAGIPCTLLELMIILSFASWIFGVLKGHRFNFKKYLQEKNNRKPYPFKWEIMAILLVSYGAVFVASLSSSALGIFKAYFFEPIIFFILVINILGKEKDVVNKIIWPMVVSALAVSLMAIYQKITGQFIFNEFWANEATRRSVSFFGFPNAVGLYLAPIVVILSAFLHQKLLVKFDRKNIREILVITLTIVLSLLSILFAQSEGALIGIAAAAVFYGLLVNKKMRQVTIVTLVVGLMLLVSTPKLLDYVKHKATLTDLSGQIRRQQWIETKKMLVNENTWILGTGLSGYQENVNPFHQEGIFLKNDDPNWLEKVRTSAEYRTQVWQPTEIYMYPHNIFLNFWTELGLLGMVLFAWVMFKYTYSSIKLFLSEKKKGVNNFIILGLGAAMIAILVHGLVDVPYFKNDLSVFFWLLLAFLGIYMVDYKNKK
ncbi:MAG: O-antigen ligase family protein [Candidatus Falkowbacteria bacterium]